MKKLKIIYIALVIIVGILVIIGVIDPEWAGLTHPIAKQKQETVPATRVITGHIQGDTTVMDVVYLGETDKPKESELTFNWLKYVGSIEPTEYVVYGIRKDGQVDSITAINTIDHPAWIDNGYHKTIHLIDTCN